MVTTTSSRVKALHIAQNAHRHSQKKAISLVAAMAGGIIAMLRRDILMALAGPGVSCSGAQTFRPMDLGVSCNAPGQLWT